MKEKDLKKIQEHLKDLRDIAWSASKCPDVYSIGLRDEAEDALSILDEIDDILYQHYVDNLLTKRPELWKN